MIEDIRLSKVDLLIQQNKYAEAEKILKELLAEDSSNIHFLYLLAEVYLQQEKYEQSNAVIDNAIGQAPDEPHLFYIKARLAILEDNYREAEGYILQAIALAPDDANYFAMHAHIMLVRKKYEEALQIADQALTLDPENLLALNTRSSALIKLNRKEESFNTIEGALREDPNNPYTHANYGWGLLEKGDYKKAKAHFKEALHHDPNNQYAQSGLLEAIKATNPIYRVFLKYSFFMGNLTAKYQWGVIIGFYIIMRLIRGLAASNEALEPYLTPLVLVLALIAFSTWVMTPVSNLFLRFNKYGQLLLDKQERMSSNFVGISFLAFLAGILLFFLMKDYKYLTIAAFGLSMMLPFGVMFTTTKVKNLLLIYAAVMAVVGMVAILQTFLTGDIFNFFTIVYLIGFVAFQWVANFQVIRQGNR